MKFDIAYNREVFEKFLKVDFLPQDFIEENSLVNITHKTTYIQEVTKLGVCDSLDLVVYEVKHSGKHDPRVGLSKESFKLLAQEWHGKAIIAFVPMDGSSNYRFSYISIDLDLTDEGRIKKSFSNPRRYSYYLGRGISYYTPNKYLNSGRVKDNKDLQDRFSVEVLTKAFYNELADWYAWAVKIVCFPNDLDDNTDDDKYNHEAVIRLVTRLIFVWFLKQKKLIPTEFFEENYIANNLIEGFNPNVKVDMFHKSHESKYYKAILQNLFFAMLNSPITSTKGEMERRFIKEAVNGKTSDFDNKKLMRYKSMFSDAEHFVEIANRGVPFLNGGLFDCLDNRDKNNFVDGFSDNPKINKSLIVPDYLFFGEEVGKDIDLSEFYGDKKKKKVSARGVIDILKRYNFTVEENTPFDQEVSLDPELLGKVFENLLAMYNPETKATARKQTGSFYTPREIVQYMVDESLIAHLKRTVGDELEEEYRKLMCYTDDDTRLTDTQKRAVINSLHDCKILDPACGSGAFPMGVLQQMVHILSRLDETNEIWKEILLDDAANETRTALKYSSKEERKEAMDDIERSFDENINRPDYARKLYLIEKCIYGVDIQSIAIQISKLRFFISLVIDQKRNNDPKDNFGIRPLPNLEAKFVAANTLIGLNKSEGNLFETPEIKVKEEELKVANHKIFGAKTFKTKIKYRNQVKELRLELSEMLLQMGYLSNDTAQLLKGWDMFDQNASSPFFDPEWMFGVNGGFDIVIGNPPYVFTRDVDFSGDFKAYIDKEYFSKVKTDKKKSKSNQSGKINLFAIFIIKGAMLNVKGGILSYIVPNNVLRTTTYDLVRKYILDNTSVQTVVDLGSRIFDKVTASTIILQLSNQLIANNILKAITNVSNIEQSKYDVSEIIQNQFLTNTSFAFNIFGDTKTIELSTKISQGKKMLGSICKDIIEGIVAHKHLISEYSESERVPLLEGKRIKRYYDEGEKKYLLWNKELIHRTRPDYLWQLDEKILIQRISGGLKPLTATIDRNKYKTFASINNLVLKDEYYTYYPYIVALINSNLINWYYANNFSNNSKLTVNISKTYLEMLPISEVSEQEKKNIESCVEEIMRLKNLSSQADTTILEFQIDQMVYSLYNLTEEEIAIIENK